MPRVIDACDQALATDQSWGYRDSRGVARALSGNVQGALEDFDFVIREGNNEDVKAQRQRWVTALRAGRNPFTAAELKTLRTQ